MKKRRKRSKILVPMSLWILFSKMLKNQKYSKQMNSKKMNSKQMNNNNNKKRRYQIKMIKKFNKIINNKSKLQINNR